MERIENVVKEVRDRYALQFPVNVESLARRIADFEYVDENAPFEGMVLPVGSGEEYKILIRRGGFNRRTRFTIAHEIGHVMIPWHYGTIIDTELQFEAEADDRREIEANYFAIELLAPLWKQDEIIKNEGFSATTISKMRNLFEISWMALARSLVPRLNRWQVLFRYNEDSETANFLHDKVYTLPHNYLVRHLRREIFVEGIICDIHKSGQRCSGIMQVDPEFVVEWSHHCRPGKLILKDILNDGGISDQEIKTANQRIGGVLGALNNQISENTDSNNLVVVLMSRIAAYPELDMVSNDERFFEFCVSKVAEFFRRKRLQHLVGEI